MTQASLTRVQKLTVDGQSALRLNNGLVQVDVLPELGGKIWNLIHVPSQTQWIWHNPKTALQKVASGASYDDHWAGGWEELFPNDAAGMFQGRNLPDHGEWWSRPWNAEALESASGQSAVRLSLEGSVLRARCEKRIEVAANAAEVTIRYRIENLEDKPIHFLFKQHLAVAVTPEHRLEVPGGLVRPVDLDFSTRLGAEGPFPWPHGLDRKAQLVDLSVLPKPQERHREFVYIERLTEGACGVRDTVTGRSLRLKFSQNTFPFTWLFCTYGGWRDLYTAVLEPCTNMPKDLNEAFRLGNCASLEPGESLTTSVSAILS